VSFAVVVLLARIALVALLYLFLLFVVRAVYRDLRTAGRKAAQAGAVQFAGAPRLVVLAQGITAYPVGHQFRLRNPTMVGRDPGSDIPVDDDFVSAQHLRLASGGAGWVAIDMNSTNGTRINGARLRGTAPLHPGDILEIGRLRLRFVVDQ
jgi:hypothetical protein